jgi:PDZ domain-containing secreted protein
MKKNLERKLALKWVLVIVIIMLVGIVRTKAQTPFDDPAGPGSSNTGSNSVQTDGSPVVPFDGGMSLILLSSGLMIGFKHNNKK